MGGDEYLRRVPSSGGMSAEFPCQCFQELVIKTVLRLLDTYEGRRIGVFQQQQINEYLERAVGHLLGEKRVVKARVVEPEQDALVLGDMRIDTRDVRYSFGDASEDGSETIAVFALHELHDVAEIVSVHVQMPLRAGGGQSACRVRCEV